VKFSDTSPTLGSTPTQDVVTDVTFNMHYNATKHWYIQGGSK